ncbi:MAG: hypothetical protein HY912_12150 [Desulfomonile tiedjei]|uniref:Lipoprotein n=1 Tax=Desulfomonile tiedjei TaxID=2358 RepID=A0A9D6V1P4_9BACT|nr:hypothetical protein [Desulfomonile tiedjei]
MAYPRNLLLVLITSISLVGCGTTKLLKGGIHRNLDEDLTIVKLTENPTSYLNKEIVFSVRYYKKEDLPCPLGDDYINISIADRVSYITLNKVWIKKGKAGILDSLKEMETIVMKAKVFKIDKERDPNLEALEIEKE